MRPSVDNVMGTKSSSIWIDYTRASVDAAEVLAAIEERQSHGTMIKFGDWTFLWQGGWALTGDKASGMGVIAFFLYMVAFMDTTATR